MTWLYLPPSTASNYSPASACSARDCEPGSTIWASRIAPSATLSGKLTQPQSWLRAWKKAPWMQRLSGPTLPPSTLDAGAGKWIASLPDFPARTCRLLVGEPGSTALGPGCFSRSSVLPTIAVRGSCFWRTSQASLLPPPPLWTRKKASSTNARSPESWGNWPTAGGMRNGSLYQHPTWAPVMDASGGFVSHGETRGCNTSSYSNGKMGPNIREQATQWLTPCVPNGGRSVSADLVASKGMTETGDKRTVGLESQTRHWATPRATDGEKGGPNQRGGRGDPILPGQVCQWATPTASENSNRTTRVAPSHGHGHGMVLAGQAASWPTPAARDGKGTNSEAHALVTGAGRKHMDQLANFVAYSPLAQPIRDGLTSSDKPHGSAPHSVSTSSRMPKLLTRRLNPYFAGWLMGWPLHWTSTAAPHASNALAMASWRCALRSRLLSCFGARVSITGCCLTEAEDCIAYAALKKAMRRPNERHF